MGKRKTAVAIAGPAPRSCGTCRDRRILCDRALPVCSACSQSKRVCKGYGIRLSWPRPRDTRRAIVACSPSDESHVPCVASADLVHVSQWDVMMHYHLMSFMSKPDAAAYTRPILYIPMQWNPFSSDLGDKELFQYFQHAASQSLTTFGHDPSQLGEVLMRIALTGDTPSAAAARKSVLALSSLHRHGVSSQSFQLKISSLKALAAASHGDLSAREVIQHVVAGMLLCSFEVHQSSCTSSQWTWYIAGVKQVLGSACLQKFYQDSDLVALMNWVHYHDVLARFTLRHWHGDANNVMATPSHIWTDAYSRVLSCKTAFPTDCQPSQAVPSSILAAVELLSEISEIASTRPQDTMSSENLEEYKGFLKILDWRIRTITITSKVDECSETAMVAKCYQLALLVYLHRVSGHLLGQAVKTQQWIETAFVLFSQLSSCERQFPVFILGCEARTDGERQTVLSLISRTEKKTSSRSVNHIRILIQAVWAQDDLADRELNYWDKMSSVISCCSIVPSLV